MGKKTREFDLEFEDIRKKLLPLPEWFQQQLYRCTQRWTHNGRCDRYKRFTLLFR